VNLCNDFIFYDIEPKNENVLFKNTLQDFPKDCDVEKLIKNLNEMLSEFRKDTIITNFGGRFCSRH